MAGENLPKCVCRVLVKRKRFPYNVGDRVCLDHNAAVLQQRKGFVRIETMPITQRDVQDAGGLESYLKANPKMSLRVERNLPPMKGRAPKKKPAENVKPEDLAPVPAFR